MTEHTTPDGGKPAASAGRGFESPEGLRALLIRLGESGPGAWRRDREAAELMRYTAVRYCSLARKYGLDAWEIASAAFEVMIAASTHRARNPWAVVTHAVQITCGAEVRAAGLLISTNKVRHMSRIVGLHDAIRFTDRAHLTDYHPAFAVNPNADDDEEPSESIERVAVALSETVQLFVAEGWDATLVADCVEDVAYRLADLSSRAHAVDVMRKDRAMPVLLGLPLRSWTALLRIVLGHPAPKYAGTSTGDGVLLRLLSGEPPDCLRNDADLLSAIRAAIPRTSSER